MNLCRDAEVRSARKLSLLVDRVHLGLADPPPPPPLWTFWTLRFKDSVVVIGPEADFTIVKKPKSGEQVITMWSPSGHHVVTK